MFTLESFMFTLGALEAHPGPVKVYLLAVEAHPGAMHAEPSFACSLVAMLTMEPFMVTLETFFHPVTPFL